MKIRSYIWQGVWFICWWAAVMWAAVFLLSECAGAADDLLHTIPNVTGADVSITRVYYVDSESGGDGRSGLSPEAAWKTIQKVNGVRFRPGSAILFRRGRVFRGAVVCSGDGLSYGAYGEGSPPVMLGSADLSDSGLWHLIGPNLWIAKVSQEVGNLILEDEVCAVRKWNVADLNGPDQFYYQKDPPAVIFYRAENPGEAHRMLEAALSSDIFSIHGRKNILISNLELKYGAGHGVSMVDVENITVQNLDISYIGGSLAWGMTDYRLGNAIQLWGSGRNILVEANRIRQIFDTGVTNQYFSGDGNLFGDQEDIWYRNNIIWDCGMGGFEIAKDTGKLGGIFFDNNTVYNMGGGWSWAVGRHEFGGFGAAMHKNLDAENAGYIFIRNNIFHTTRPWAILYGNGPDIFVSWPNMVIDCNLYFSDDDGQMMLQIAGKSGWLWQFILNQFESYQALYGWDVYSQVSDPLFINAANGDFRLSEGSPAVDAGVAAGNGIDAAGRPRGDAPDIGALEFIDPASVQQVHNQPGNSGVLMDQNIPNPFNAATAVVFTIFEPQTVTLEVFDSRGRKVAVLMTKQRLERGQHRVLFDGDGLPSGVYCCRLVAGDRVLMKKMLLVK